MLKDLLSHLPNIHKEGYLFIAIFVVVTFFLFSFSETLGTIALIVTIWCVCFFRDPARVTPIGEGLVVSPADGIVTFVGEAEAPQELGFGKEKRTRVSIFLSVFDVHVNRVPVAGDVTKLHYHAGKFVSATLDKSSDLNERQSILITGNDKKEYGVVQIAGLIARRIVCDLDEKQTVSPGQRFGIIRFGSRVDVYLPKGVNPTVGIGQKMVGGETVIAASGAIKVKEYVNN